MRVLSELPLKFSQPQWHWDPELAIFDTVFTRHPERLDLVKDEVFAVGKQHG